MPKPPRMRGQPSTSKASTEGSTMSAGRVERLTMRGIPLSNSRVSETPRTPSMRTGTRTMNVPWQVPCTTRVSPLLAAASAGRSPS